MPGGYRVRRHPEIGGRRWVLNSFPPGARPCTRTRAEVPSETFGVDEVGWIGGRGAAPAPRRPSPGGRGARPGEKNGGIQALGPAGVGRRGTWGRVYAPGQPAVRDPTRRGPGETAGAALGTSSARGERPLLMPGKKLSDVSRPPSIWICVVVAAVEGTNAARAAAGVGLCRRGAYAGGGYGGPARPCGSTAAGESGADGVELGVAAGGERPAGTDATQGDWKHAFNNLPAGRAAHGPFPPAPGPRHPAALTFSIPASTRVCGGSARRIQG